MISYSTQSKEHKVPVLVFSYHSYCKTLSGEIHRNIKVKMQCGFFKQQIAKLAERKNNFSIFTYNNTIIYSRFCPSALCYTVLMTGT